MARQTKRGEWGVSPLSLDRKLIWKIWPILALRFDSLILKTHSILLWGVSNMHFHLYHYPTILWQSSSNSKKELGILEVGWKGLNKDLTIFNWYTLCTRVTKKQFLKRNLLIVLQQKFSLPNNLWWCFASKDAFPFFHILDTFQGQIRLISFIYKSTRIAKEDVIWEEDNFSAS